jgi:transcriptional regulator with XRE-family HTH domain
MTATEPQISERTLTLADEVALYRRLPPPHIRRTIRTRAKVSFRRFGAEIGVSHGSVRYYENGGCPGVEIAIRYLAELEKLAAAIGYDIAAETRAAGAAHQE